MAEHGIDARSRTAAGCALIGAKRYSSAPLPVPGPPQEGRPGGNQLGKLAARLTKNGPQ
jgi:hypothetical protein